MNEKLTRVLNLISWVLLATIAALLIHFSYLMLFDDNPPSTVDLPIQVDKEFYEPGDEIALSVNICRYTDVAAHLYVSYFNLDTGIAYIQPETAVSSAPQGCSYFTRVEIVPEVPPGTYVRRSRAEYQVNALIARSVDMYTEEFEVTE